MKNVMKNISWIVIIAMIVGLCIAFIPTNTIANATTIVEEKTYCSATLEDDFADGTLLMVINNQASISRGAYTIADFPEIDCAEVDDMFLECEAQESFDESTYHKIVKITLANSGKQNVLDAIHILEKRQDVLYASPDYYTELADSGSTNYQNTNNVDGTWWQDAIDLPEARQIESGDCINIGIIDSGIDLDHPDLQGKILAQYGKNYVPGELDTYLEDECGHGTKVAGIIAGTYGVYPNAQLIPIRVYRGSGVNDGPLSQIADGISYAQQLNLKVINMSLGKYLDETTTTTDINLLNTALANFQGLAICAAGNKNFNIDISANVMYPACCSADNIITVGASDENDERLLHYSNEGELEGGSNYGLSSVDVFAPGANIYTTIIGGTLEKIEGATSFATPVVTGIAALLLSNNPDMTTQELRCAIINSVDVVEDVNGNPVFGNICVSGGRVNAYNALTHVHNYGSFTPDNINTHSRTCLTCEYTYTTTHTWLTNSSGGWKCWICGMTTLIKPVINPGYLSIGGEIYVVDGEWCCKLSDLVLIDGQYYMRAENTLATQEIDHLLT